jgi:hypothetical protein
MTLILSLSKDERRLDISRSRECPWRQRAALKNRRNSGLFGMRRKSERIAPESLTESMSAFVLILLAVCQEFLITRCSAFTEEWSLAGLSTE